MGVRRGLMSNLMGSAPPSEFDTSAKKHRFCVNFAKLWFLDKEALCHLPVQVTKDHVSGENDVKATSYAVNRCDKVIDVNYEPHWMIYALKYECRNATSNPRSTSALGIYIVFRCSFDETLWRSIIFELDIMIQVRFFMNLTSDDSRIVNSI